MRITYTPQRDMTAYEAGLIVVVDRLCRDHGHPFAKQYIENKDIERHFSFSVEEDAPKFKWPWNK